MVLVAQGVGSASGDMRRGGDVSPRNCGPSLSLHHHPNHHPAHDFYSKHGQCSTVRAHPPSNPPQLRA